MKVQSQTNDQLPQHQELPVSPVFSTSYKRPTVFIYTFLTSGEFIWLEFESGQGWCLYIFHKTLSGLVTLQCQKLTQKYASGKTSEKNLHVISYHAGGVHFICVRRNKSITGKTGDGVLLCKKKKPSMDIHLESTNNING